jgi:hypothetical protein
MRDGNPPTSATCADATHSVSTHAWARRATSGATSSICASAAAATRAAVDPAVRRTATAGAVDPSVRIATAAVATAAGASSTYRVSAGAYRRVATPAPTRDRPRPSGSPLSGCSGRTSDSSRAGATATVRTTDGIRAVAGAR